MWSDALKYYIKLNNCFKDIFGRNIKNYKEDMSLMNKHLYENKIVIATNEDGEKKKVLPYSDMDIDFSRSLEDMSIDDMMIFSTLLISSQNENYLLFKYSDVAVWNLDILETKMAFIIYNKLLRYFRGIVLDIKNFDVVNTPFDKFANMGEYGWEENSVENITKEFKDANVIEVSDKLDGSLQSIRYYNGAFIHSGSGCVVLEQSPSLAEANEWFIENENYQKMIRENPNDTHIFEWISLADAHIVFYNGSQKGLYLIGIRNSLTGEQYSYADIVRRANDYGVKCTTLYTYTLEDILKDCKKYSSREKEGFVVKLDNHFVKIKCDDYVEVARILKTQSSFNELVRVVCYDKVDDVLAKLPDATSNFITYRIAYIYLFRDMLDNKINSYYEQAPKGSTKEYMVWVHTQVPSQFQSELVNKYTNKPNHYLGYAYENKNGDWVESFKKLSDIEDLMKIMGGQTLMEYLSSQK